VTEEYPKITVVIPVKNEARYIARTIDYLLSQDYPHDKVEILVGVGESTDRSAEIVKEIESREPRVKYFYNQVGLSSGARNIGARMASGEIIIYIDGHTYIDNNRIFANTVRLIEEKDVSILSRPQFLDTPENDFFQRAVSLVRKSLIGHGLDSTIYSTKEEYVDPSSSGATYKKEVFEKIGYFDENFDASEDYEFNYRAALAGLRSFTSMKLAVYYYPRSTLSGLFKQMIRYGIGRFRLARKYPSSLSLGTLIPFLFTIGIPVAGLLSLVSNFFLYIFLVVLGCYIVLIGVSSLMVALKNGLAYIPILPAIYFIIHIGLGWGFFAGFCRFLFRFEKNAKNKVQV
jgi:GT2 family glycosyltransferase